MKATLLNLDQPNANHRTYPIGSMQAAFDPEKIYLGIVGAPDQYTFGATLDLSSAAFTVEGLSVEGSALVGQIKILNTPAGELLKAMGSTIAIRPNGVGVVDDRSNVTDYQIVSFSAMPASEAT